MCDPGLFQFCNHIFCTVFNYKHVHCTVTLIANNEKKDPNYPIIGSYLENSDNHIM